MKNFTKIKNLTQDETKKNRLNNVTEVVCEGKGLNPGIVIGRAYVYNPVLKSVPRYEIAEADVEKEKKRFAAAVEVTSRQLETIGRQTNLPPDDPVIQLFDIYRRILTGSRLVRGVAERIEKDRLNAEAALQIEIATLSETFAKISDSYLASRLDDIKGLAMRIVKNLTAHSSEKRTKIPQNAIVVAERLTTADATFFDLKNVVGILIEKGAQQSHAALLSRSLELPAIISVPDLTDCVRTGDILIIDGTYGKVIVNPLQETITRYRKYRADFLRWKRRMKRLGNLPCVTPDNVSVSLKGNIDLVAEAEILLQAGADGVGLLRSEYLFMNRSDLPSEEEQFQVLCDVSDRLGNRPVTFRTLDADGDKMLSVLPEGTVNPTLSIRGIRCALKYPNVLETQFAAVLRASVYGTFNILLPMISSVEELKTAKEILYRVAARLREEGKEIPEKLPALGVMIEVPSAALEAESLAKNCDFLSIGTNDLIQYTLAVDRSDENVSVLFNPLHPAILKLIKMTADAARGASIPLCVCGDMAASPLYAPLLLGMGVRELSMPATNLPLVKERILRVRMDEMESFAANVLTLTEIDDISAAVNGFSARFS